MRVGNLLILGSIAVALIALGGCAPSTSYVSMPTSVDAIAQYSVLEVAPIEIKGEGFDEVNDEQLAAIREEFVKRFTKKKIVQTVVETAEDTDGAMVLKSEITSYNKVSAVARFFFGSWAGASKLTLHVGLYDKASDKLLAETDMIHKDRASLSANPVKMGKRMAKSVGNFIEKRGLGGKAARSESEF